MSQVLLAPRHASPMIRRTLPAIALLACALSPAQAQEPVINVYFAPLPGGDLAVLNKAIQEALSQRNVASGSAGADKGGALPRQSARFVVRDGGVHGKRDRRHLGRRPQPQVDSLHVAIGRSPLQKFDQPAADANGNFSRIVTIPTRQSLGVEQQQQIDIRRVVELMAAELAHCDHRESARYGVGNALANGGGDGDVDCLIGEVGKQTSRLFERKLARFHAPDQLFELRQRLLGRELGGLG